MTGAETPLGLRIIQTLIRQGCRVHGIGNNFSKVTYADPQFKGHAIDLSDLEAVASKVGEILEQEKRLHLLVHAIDVTPGNAFEKLPAGNLEAVLKVGLLGPVMMTRLALPNLLRFRGQLINVITANKHGHVPSAANALIEGGLREMNKALFNQGRDAGLRVTNCVLRQNTELPSATVGDDVLKQSHIDLGDVARTIEHLIDPKAVNVPEEVVLYPRVSAAATESLPDAPLPIDPYSAVVLPPKEYCPPEQPKIPTEKKQQIERTIPYTDEEMEEKIAAAIEDFEAHPERYEQPDPAPQKQNKPQQQGQGGPQQDGQSNKKRRRRRGGRNRNRGNREEGQDAQSGPKESRPAEAKTDAPKQEGPSANQNDSPDKDRQAPKKHHRPKRGGRGGRSKADEPATESGHTAPQANATGDRTDNSGPQSEASSQTDLGKQARSSDQPVKKKAAKKRPAKKASSDKAVSPPQSGETPAPVKKAAKKAAKKKTAAKKAAKKKTAAKKAAKKKPAKKAAPESP